ncbi:SURF1 family protein [Nocardioides zeae]|uniref:SURF1-like protein n=1 Tax=Nocardioides imazamoxiresistens TaxID=3231893 RepID=A0ABU3PVX4_9ACTN|nr:SURF1 family protein [Nocardioides zeae]MDT9593031.1 SURF1 family protein [Nocardioides zeae]
MAARDLHPALRPRVLPIHLLGVVAVAVAVGLGNWQLDAWQAHRDLAAAEVVERDPVPLSDLLEPGGSFPAADAGAPVEVAGTWVPDQTFFVDDRVVDGVDGFWVVTPIAPDGGDGTLLPLVRGWTPSLDAVPADPTGRAEVVAWLQPGEGTGAADPDATDRVLPQVRLADVVRLLDTRIYDGYAVVDATGEAGAAPVNGGADGLEAVDPDQVPSPGFGTGLRNLLYAIEWWIFASFAAFVWWRFVRDEVERARAADEVARSESSQEESVPSAP